MTDVHCFGRRPFDLLPPMLSAQLSQSISPYARQVPESTDIISGYHRPSLFGKAEFDEDETKMSDLKIWFREDVSKLFLLFFLALFWIKKSLGVFGVLAVCQFKFRRNGCSSCFILRSTCLCDGWENRLHPKLSI